MENFHLHPSLISALTHEKITKATPIQEKAIPLILDHQDVIGLSETGSGKTLAYLLPLISQLIGRPKKNILGLILVPTKELALQVHSIIKKLTRENLIYTQVIIGGENPTEQLREYQKGHQILVATPGRLCEHLQKEHIDLSLVEYLVLDEADVMTDMGYLPQLEVILSALNEKKQTMLFSATMNELSKNELAPRMNRPVLIELHENRPKEIIVEYFCPIEEKQKIPFLKFLFKEEKIRSGLIFVNTKEKARELHNELLKSNYKVTLLEGEMSTHQRQKSLTKFRAKDTRFLIATDVASRGIDISHITHIINFEVPLNRDSYIHRIGRTARYEGQGTAITLYRPDLDDKNLARIYDQITPKKYKNFVPNILKKR